jgi:hypothetical protein
MTKLFLFALILAGGVSSSTKAQELVKGTFTLGTEARFGGTLLPAGHYTVSVEPVTSIAASGSRVLVFVRPETKSGPVASVFAMASAEACDTPIRAHTAVRRYGFSRSLTVLFQTGAHD